MIGRMVIIVCLLAAMALAGSMALEGSYVLTLPEAQNMHTDTQQEEALDELNTTSTGGTLTLSPAEQPEAVAQPEPAVQDSAPAAQPAATASVQSYITSTNPPSQSTDYLNIEPANNSYTQSSNPINPFIYVDNKTYKEIARGGNPHKEDGIITGATELNNGEDFALLWTNGKVRFYHESELDNVKGLNASIPADIHPYKEFQTLANPSSGIVEIPPGLWPGEYKYQICNGSPTCQNATGYTWGDIVVSDEDSLWFYTKDGALKSRMYVFITDPIRDIAYDKEFNRFFALTDKISKVLVRNDKYLVFINATNYCDSSNNCAATQWQDSIKVFDMENSPNLTNNMLMIGHEIYKMKLNGDLDLSSSWITTNILNGMMGMAGKAYTNRYSLEAYNNGFFLYFGGYDNGPQNPQNVTRFTAHLQKNVTNIFYPYVKSLSPINEYIETKTNTLTFTYTVNFSGQLDSCSLVENNITLETANNVLPDTNQTFVHTFTNGVHYWSIRCNVAGLIGASDLRNFTVNYAPSFNQIDWLASQQDLYATGLVDSYEGDGQRYAYIYDQALAIIAFTNASEPERARDILDELESLQQPGGGWYECYDAQTGTIGHPGCDSYVTGPIAWVVMAINYYEHNTGDDSYASVAKDALSWMDSVRNTNPAVDNYGSLRFCSGGSACTIPNAISTEHNHDAYAAYRWRGIIDNNTDYLNKAELVRQYLVNEMWAPSPDSNGPYHNVGIFWRGYNESPNWGWCTDPQTWGILSLGTTGPSGEDFTLSLEWLYWNPYGSTRNQQDYNAGITDVDGFKSCTGDPNYIWLEGTEGAAAAYYLAGQDTRGDYFHGQIGRVASPNGGIIHTFSETSPGTIRWPDNFRHNSIASTVWYYFNDEKLNPFILTIAPPKVKFRTTDTTYNAFTKLAINENCTGEPLGIYESKLFVVGLKNCTGEYGNNSALMIRNLPYSGGMFGGLWECDSQLDLYKYDKGYYVCCRNMAKNYTLSKSYYPLNTTETSESVAPEREISC